MAETTEATAAAAAATPHNCSLPRSVLLFCFSRARLYPSIPTDDQFIGDFLLSVT